MSADVDGCSLFPAVDDVPLPLLLPLAGGGVLDALLLSAPSSGCEAFFLRAISAIHSARLCDSSILSSKPKIPDVLAFVALRELLSWLPIPVAHALCPSLCTPVSPFDVCK